MPLPNAQAAKQENLSVELFLDDSQKHILGIEAATEKPVNAFYEATELDKAGKHDKAERIYQEILNTDFGNPVILAALGMNYASTGRSGMGMLLLNKALEGVEEMIPAFTRLGVIPKLKTDEDREGFKRIKRSEILNAIGTCYKHENRTQEAREYFESAQALVPLNADIQNNLGTLYINEGKPEEAMQILDKAIGVKADHAQAHWNRSLAYLELGHYEQGWKEYDYGFPAKVRMERNYTKEPLPMWDGSKGKTIIVHGEQGIGDEILFASMLPDLIRDSECVVFECHKKLHRLFANSFPVIDIYPTREDPMITWSVMQDGSLRYPFDAKIAIGSLGRYYRNSIDAFPATPYIKPTQAAEQKWAQKLAELPRKPKIGISWIGGHKRTRIEVRSMHLAMLEPILRHDANWISLQYTPAEQEIEEFTKKTGIAIHHWPDACYNADYDQTAGLVANLDLVITVCTSLVHLAGSMGVPTWVMTPSRPAWRYRLDLDYLPWYNSVTLFRQQRGSTEWGPVISEISGKMSELMESITC